MIFSRVLEAIPSLVGLLTGDLPQQLQTDLSLFLLEAVGFVNANVILSLYLFVEVNILEVFGEELAHYAVVSVVLGEVFNHFLALF